VPVKNSAPLALLQQPALRPVLNLIQDLFQGRLLLPALALGGLLLSSGYPTAWAQPRPDSAKADTIQEYIGKRNPWAALGLSMVCPGAGQLYNHEKEKGFLMMGVWIPCYIYAAWFASQVDSMPYHYIHFDKVSTVEVMLGIAAGVACLVVPIWSDIDAHSSAWRINRKYGYEPPPAKRPPKRNVWAALGFSCLLPGGGQIYNQQYLKSALCVATYAVGAGVSLPDKHPQQELGNTLMVGAMVGSLIDAPLTARRFNRMNSDYEQSRPKIGLIFVPDPRNPRRLQPGVGLRAGF